MAIALAPVSDPVSAPVKAPDGMIDIFPTSRSSGIQRGLTGMRWLCHRCGHQPSQSTSFSLQTTSRVSIRTPLTSTLTQLHITFSERCLGWLHEDAKVSKFIIKDLEHLALWHGQADESLEERDTSHVQMVAQLKAHRLFPFVCLQ